jgi:hypothetical protein
MNILFSVVIITIICCSIVLSYNKTSSVNKDEVKIGQIWYYNVETDDPFPKKVLDITVKIIDVKDGWVRYGWLELKENGEYEITDGLFSDERKPLYLFLHTFDLKK